MTVKSVLTRLIEKDHKKALTALIEGTDIGRRLIAEIEDERLAERRRLAEDLERLEAEDAAAMQALGEESRRTEAAHRAASEALRDAMNATSEMGWKVERQIRSAQRARNRILDRLQHTADPQTNDFIEWADTQIASLRRGRASPAAVDDVVAGQIRDAVRNRLLGLKAAREAAFKLRLSPASPVEIGEAIARLRDELPPDPGGEVGTLAGFDDAAAAAATQRAKARR